MDQTYTDHELLLLISQSLKEVKEELKELKNSFPQTYATKSELQLLEQKLQPALNLTSLIAKVTITVLVSALLGTVIIQKFIP